MRCPYCQNDNSKVIDTTHDSHGGIRRRRECLSCGERFSSYERPVLATPLIVKQDGTREEFDREKLERGIRIACAKRPVSAADIERLVGQVEADLQQLGKPEISSRVVGDLVIKGLKAPQTATVCAHTSIRPGALRVTPSHKPPGRPGSEPLSILVLTAVPARIYGRWRGQSVARPGNSGAWAGAQREHLYVGSLARSPAGIGCKRRSRCCRTPSQRRRGRAQSSASARSHPSTRSSCSPSSSAAAHGPVCASTYGHRSRPTTLPIRSSIRLITSACAKMRLFGRVS